MSFYSELKRRNVFRVAAGYVVLSWLLLQVADVLMDTIGLPAIWGKAVLGLLLIGFLPVLIFSWVYEMTPEGIRREKEIAREASVTAHTAKKLDMAVIVLLLVALAVFALDRFSGAPAVSGDPIASTAPAHGVIPVVAVLPLQALSTEDEGIFLASGLHDDLLTRLARLQAFKVISRTSVMEYAGTTKNLREIGAELGANYILEGGLQAIGGNVRINAQLIDAASDEHLWAETYNRALTTANLFDVQADIAAAIAEALHATLSPQEIEQLGGIPTQNLKAYEAFLRGHEYREQLTLPAIHGAVAAYREAVELDPKFGEAWALLSLSLIRQYWEEGAEDGASPNESLVDESLGALQKAQQLMPNAATTFMSEAYYYYYGFRDYSSALIALGRAEAISPNDFRILALRGYLLRRVGRISESSDALLQAMQVNPNSVSLFRETAQTLIGAGRCDEAHAMVDEALRRYPDDDGVLDTASSAYLFCGAQTATALRYARQVKVTTLQQLRGVHFAMLAERDYAGAIAVLVAARDSWVRRPTVHLLIDNSLVWLYRQTGQAALAAQALQSAAAHAAQVTDRGLTSLVQLMTLAALQGDKDATRQLGAEAIAVIPDDAWRESDFVQQIAAAYALAGLNDEALSTLEGVRYGGGFQFFSALPIDPYFAALRDDPRLQKIIARIPLP